MDKEDVIITLICLMIATQIAFGLHLSGQIQYVSGQIQYVSGSISDQLDRLSYLTDMIRGEIATPPPQQTSPVPEITPTPTPSALPIVTPTPTRTLIPTPTPATPSVGMTKPADDASVSWRYMVEGSSTAIQDTNLNAYVLIWPIEADGPWWVQPTTTSPDGGWQSYAYFGRDPDLYPEDAGTTYRVVAIITRQTLLVGNAFTSLPDHVAKSKEKLVTRTAERYETP